MYFNIKKTLCKLKIHKDFVSIVIDLIWKNRYTGIKDCAPFFSSHFLNFPNLRLRHEGRVFHFYTLSVDFRGLRIKSTFYIILSWSRYSLITKSKKNVFTKTLYHFNLKGNFWSLWCFMWVSYAFIEYLLFFLSVISKAAWLKKHTKFSVK